MAGHRVVHGGPLFTSPVVVDSVQRASLEALSELAPLHNPPALSAIDTFFRLRPRTPSVVCFNTAFHAHLPAEAAAYALPSEWVARWGIRRFGFHGLSCAWAASQAERLLNRPIERLRLVICHLGGGASVTAVSSGRSVDTSMGFTPLEGLVMATRPGDVDPGAVLWALRHGLSARDADPALEHDSGLLGLPGGQNRERSFSPLDPGEHRLNLPVRVYPHRLPNNITSVAASSSGDATIFFAGGVTTPPPSVPPPPSAASPARHHHRRRRPPGRHHQPSQHLPPIITRPPPRRPPPKSPNPPRMPPAQGAPHKTKLCSEPQAKPRRGP